MRAACAGLLCFAALTAPVAGETRLPATTELVGGVLADDGDLFVVVRGADANEGSYLIRSSAAGSDVFDLPNAWVKSVRALHDGKLLLFSKRRSIVDGHGSLGLDIVTVTADEVVESWGWDSSAECGTGGCEPPVVSGDGSFWGTTGWTEEEPDIVTFAFGRTRPAGRKIMRTKVVDLGAPNRNFPRSSFFWFLDSDEDVVMLPWNGGAFIVHFVEGGTPYALPVLQGGAEKDMRWQDGDRVLWIEEAGQWRAYHLWDLGLSGVRDEAFWQLEVKDGWKPHPERGVARVVSGEGGYRVEHLWREPWTTLEERRVSDWYPGQPPRGRLGWDWMVSANGRRAAIVERRSPEEGTVEFHVRHLDLSLEPQPPPPIEAPQADDLIRLPGRVKGGLVDAGGHATLLVEDVEARSSALVLLDGGDVRGTIDLPPMRVGTELTRLTDGRLLLGSQDATTMHDRVQHYDIVEIFDDKLKFLWSWNSRDALPDFDNGSDGIPVAFSGDGRGWGIGGGTFLSFGEIVPDRLLPLDERFGRRRERLVVGEELDDLRKWEGFEPDFIYLDSAGPVVLTPWNKGAWIVHFAEIGSPLVTPVLFDNGVEEYHFFWQWEERVLWAETSLYWKGYELPDLGLSGMADEPIWVLDKSSGAPHPERGVVQLGIREDAYRVEHSWRDPMTRVDGRRVSAWYPVYRVPDDTGQMRTIRPTVSPYPRAGNDVFVDADGCHAVVVEDRRRSFYGAGTYYARALTLQPASPAPPVEADRDAEAAADRERLGELDW